MRLVDPLPWPNSRARLVVVESSGLASVCIANRRASGEHVSISPSPGIVGEASAPYAETTERNPSFQVGVLYQ